MSLPKVSDCSVHISVREHNAIAHAEPEYVRSIVIEDMRRRMGAFIVNAKLTTNVEEFSTEYRMSLLVFNPDDFYGIVREEAMRLMRYMPYVK